MCSCLLLGMRTSCHDGRVSWSLQVEALAIVLVGDARADEAAVRARRNIGVYLLALVVRFGSWRYIGW